MGSVKKVGDEWFAYGVTRTYGPFKSEAAAWRKLREEGEF